MKVQRGWDGHIGEEMRGGWGGGIMGDVEGGVMGVNE